MNNKQSKKRTIEEDDDNQQQPPVKKQKTLTSKKQTRVVKLERKNGKVIQDCDVYIGRAINRGGWKLSKSKWHNPYKGNNTLEQYREYVTAKPELMNALNELDGKILGCWCKKKGNEPCHGDVLVQLLKESKKTKQEEEHDDTN
jgi:hypothetical protein